MKKILHEYGVRRRILIIACVLAVLQLTALTARSQSLTVSGVVKNGEEPVPGVSVLEKGTSSGTTTDAEGHFSMTIGSPTAALVFSFIGYKTLELPLNNQTRLDVQLEEDVTALNEVIVTALGVQRDVKALG